VKSKKKNNQKDEEVDIQEEIKKEKIIPKKLSYHEQREFEQLGNEIATLDMRKDEINAAFQEDLDSDKIVLLSKELSELVKLGEQKEKRWFELAERE
jgi:ATP-binding cassette subfamily F protein uup